MKRVRDLQPGDWIDLDSCPYAVPGPDDPPDLYAYEWSIVERVEEETPGCWLVVTESDGAFGMPPDYVIRTQGNEPT